MGNTPSSERPRRVAVLGGGPAGLTAAYRLLKTCAPVHVDIYEASPRFGGSVLTESTPALSHFDLGPNSMNLKHPAVAHLVLSQLGMSDDLQPRQSARRILVMRAGKLHPVPLSPPALLRTPLLSTAAKLRMLREPFVKKLDDAAAAKESIADFVSRRFGREVLDYLVDPALAGIYSAAPHQLSVKHAFPKLYELERRSGSILGGLLFSRPPRKPKTATAAAAPASAGKPAAPGTLGFTRKQLTQSFSFRGGMAALPARLETTLRSYTRPEARARLRAGTPVRALERDADGSWRVNGRGGYDAVVSTLPAHALRNVTTNSRSVRRAFSKLAARVRYAPVAVAVLGFDRADVPADVEGFGALFPSREGRRILGVNFTSHGFPERVNDKDRVFWTVYMGGARHPHVLLRKPEEIVRMSTEELNSIFGFKGKPVFARVQNWPLGIPVYHPGYDSMHCTMARLEKRATGLVLGGNYRGGVGLPDALLSGMQCADRVRQLLEKRRAGDGRGTAAGTKAVAAAGERAKALVPAGK